MTFGGLRLPAFGDVMLCLTGVPAPSTAEGRPVPHAAPITLRDGHVLSIGMPDGGLRTYLSFRGGLAVPQVLGSSSTDTMSRLGPAPVRAGQVLEIGQRIRGYPHIELAPVAPRPSGLVQLCVLPGPPLHWFASFAILNETTWSVSSRSDRKGILVDGSPIQRRRHSVDAELPSEGMVRGAIQVPRNGQRSCSSTTTR